MAGFRWTKKAEDAALSLADGYNQTETSARVGVPPRTLYNWLQTPEFSEEVDRLSFMVGIAHKAERLRLAKRVVRALDSKTEKDLLDWLKYLQGETDGVKLDLTDFIAAVTQNGKPLAGSRSE